MRIAVVCATYVQGKSYQENIWAEQLAKAGHTVRAIGAGSSTGPVQTCMYHGTTYETQMVASRRWMRGAFTSRALPHAVAEFAPDLIVVCGDKTFIKHLCTDRGLAAVPMISTYSENLAMHEFDWRKRGISLNQRLWAIGFILARGPSIRTACRRSRLIVGNTPQAREILSRLFSRAEWARVNARMIDAPLGFSPEHFRFDPVIRHRVRAELGIHDRDVVVCVSSHFIPVKEPSISLIIRALADVMASQSDLRAIIVGFSEKPESSAVSGRISTLIEESERMIHEQSEKSSAGARFIKHPFADRARLVELYNASDIAAFNRASISCQEALGTGLVGCFSDDGSLNHLVTLADQGVFFRPGDAGDLAAKLAPAVSRLSALDVAGRDQFRRTLAEGSRWLGYDQIIARILQELASRRNQI